MLQNATVPLEAPARPRRPAREPQSISIARHAWATAASSFMLVAGYAATYAVHLPQFAPPLFLAAFAVGFCAAAPEVARSLLRGRIDINLLMILAGSAAAGLGYWDEAALLMFLFSLSNLLELHGIGRTRRSLEGLIGLRPEQVRILGPGAMRLVKTALVSPGQRIRIAPGERIPLDAKIVSGTTTIDQSAMTGESMPVEVGAQDLVWAGTLNLEGEIDVEVLAAESETKLARIIDLIEEARQSKGSSQRVALMFGDRYARGVLVLCAGLAVLPPLAGAGWTDSFYRAMTVLVVASPCALVLATPAAVLSAIGAAAKAGILIKGGGALEALGRIRAIAFDKTGTLTLGAPKVQKVLALSGASESDVLRLAASAEQSIGHPLARALVAAARGRGLRLSAARNLRSRAGLGVAATVQGQEIRVGRLGPSGRSGIGFASRDWGDGPAIARTQATIEVMEKQGWTCFGVARDRRLIGIVAVADEPRPESSAALAELRRLGLRHIVMLTGDNARVAESVASKLGVDHVYAGLLPEEKSEAIGRAMEEFGCTAMVGDGINDAPAMGASCVSVAMGGMGAEAALETADVVLMTDDLRLLPRAVDLGRRASRIIRQNFLIATATMGILVFLAVAGLAPLPAAVVGHEGTTVLVLLNGLRLLKPLARP